MPGAGHPHLVPLYGARLGLAGRALGIALLHFLFRGDAVHIRLRFYYRPALVQPRERSNAIKWRRRSFFLTLSSRAVEQAGQFAPLLDQYLFFNLSPRARASTLLPDLGMTTRKVFPSRPTRCDLTAAGASRQPSSAFGLNNLFISTVSMRQTLDFHGFHSINIESLRMFPQVLFHLRSSKVYQ